MKGNLDFCFSWDYQTPIEETIEALHDSEAVGGQYALPSTMVDFVMSSFSLGQTSVSQCAAATLAANCLNAGTFFARHAAGDNVSLLRL